MWMKIKNFDSSLILPGDIICVGEKKFDIFTAGIKLLTKSKVNHVGILAFIDGEWYVQEAKLLNGFVNTPLDSYLQRYKDDKIGISIVRLKRDLIESFDLGVNAYDKVIATVLYTTHIWAKYNLKYDVSAIAGFSVICWLKILGRKLNIKNNWLQSKNKLFCSESVCIAYYTALSSLGYKFKKSIFAGKVDTSANCSTISPKDVRKSFSVSLVTGDGDMV